MRPGTSGVAVCLFALMTQSVRCCLDERTRAAHPRTDPRVLLLRYEDMKTDIRGCVQEIIDHCDLPISDDKLTELLPKFSFQYMKTNLAKFSPKTVSRWGEVLSLATASSCFPQPPVPKNRSIP